MGTTVSEYRQDPEFLKLQEQIAKLQEEQDKLWRVLLEKFPAPEGMTWCLMKTGILSVQGTYGDQ